MAKSHLFLEMWCSAAQSLSTRLFFQLQYPAVDIAQRWPLTWFICPPFAQALASCKTTWAASCAAQTTWAGSWNQSTSSKTQLWINKENAWSNEGLPSTQVTITILFTALSICSSLGNRNEGVTNWASIWPTKVAPLKVDTGGRRVLVSDFCLPAPMFSKQSRQLKLKRFVLFFTIWSQAYVKNTQLKTGRVEKYTGHFLLSTKVAEPVYVQAPGAQTGTGLPGAALKNPEGREHR